METSPLKNEVKEVKEHKIIVKPHDPAWLTEFASVKVSLEELFKIHDVPVLSIEHNGSTSIPGLLAKPILDIDIVISPSPASLLSRAREILVQAGYTDLGEMNVPGRVGFRQPGYGRGEGAKGGPGKWGEMRRNTYVCVEGSLGLRNHRDVKRILMGDEDLRREYGEVKKRLAESGIENIGVYARGKNDILERILRKAGLDEEELEEVKKGNL